MEKLNFTIKEAAQILSVSRITLYRLVESKQIEHRRIGNRILFSRDVLESYGIQPVETKVESL